jgi:anti-sigma-K factor RskA
MNGSHDDMRELVAAYVLGAVPPEEEPFIRAHISTCDECMAEADRYSETSASLALAVESAPLPKDFADKVLAAARGPQEKTARVPAERKPFRLSIPALVGGIAVLLAFAVMTTALIQKSNDLDRADEALTAMVHSEGVVELKGAGAVARVVPTASETYLVVAGLQEAPSNHTYQLWFMDDGTPVSAGVFDVDEGLAIFEADRSLEGFDGAAISVEPEGGSTEPTTAPIMVSEA